MGLLRHRNEELGGERFLMREKLLSIGDDFWIENADGERAYKVNGKALRVRHTFVLEDTSGREVARIQERKLSIRDKMAIERDGGPGATVNAGNTARPRLNARTRAMDIRRHKWRRRDLHWSTPMIDYRVHLRVPPLFIRALDESMVH